MTSNTPHKEIPAPVDLISAFREKFGVKPDQKLPADTQRVLESLSKINPKLSDPVIRPLRDNTPTNSDIDRWKESFIGLFTGKERAQVMTDLLLNNLNRVSQDEFESKLVQTFIKAKESLKKRDPSKMRFLYYAGGNDRSGNYIKKICREYLPEDEILSLPLINLFDSHYRKKDTEPTEQFETGIIFDDASYSAKQVIGHMRSGHNEHGMSHFIIILPFITNFALNEIHKAAQEMGVTVEVFYDEIMPSVKEIFDEAESKGTTPAEEELFQTLRLYGGVNRIHGGQTLTYFAHSIPDSQSFCPFLSDSRYVQHNWLVELLPRTPSVYHPEYLASVQDSAEQN